MRVALLSDVHANLPALEAVLAAIDADPAVEAGYHLGDLVGYGPWPNETVSLLAERGLAGVAGNYDSTVALDADHCGCRYEDPEQEQRSHASFAWTKRHCTALTGRRLAGLPFRLDLRPQGGHRAGPTLILVHGAPTLNTLYWTEDRPDEFNRKMAGLAGARRGDVVAFGHTHRPWVREVDGITFVNTGSVGRPKDGDWRAGFVTLDLETPAGEPAPRWRVQIRRVSYDLERTVAAIQRSDLPDELAAELRAGGPASRQG